VRVDETSEWEQQMSKRNLSQYIDDVAHSLSNFNEKLNLREHRQRITEAWKARRPVSETVQVILDELGRRYSL
jgi:hypothetical protein